MEIIKQVVLPRRALRNPQPSMNPGGDCGACALAGVLGVSVPVAYSYHCSGNYHSGEPISRVSPFSIYSMQKTLESLVNDWDTHMDRVGLLEHVVVDIPIWPYDSSLLLNASFGMRGNLMYCWRANARAMLHGGYYGIGQVQHGGFSETPNLNTYGTSNHWILIVGHRIVHESREHSRSLHEELLISDSSLAMPAEQWINCNDFQSRWGGFATLWAKPAK